MGVTGIMGSIIPPLCLTVFVQIMNMPLVRSTITIQVGDCIHRYLAIANCLEIRILNQTSPMCVQRYFIFTAQKELKLCGMEPQQVIALIRDCWHHVCS